MDNYQRAPEKMPYSNMGKNIPGGLKQLGPVGGPPGPLGGWLCQRMSIYEEILFNIMVAFLQLIPQSTLTTVFPISGDIAKSFEISNPSVLPWLVAAYATSFGTFILIGGRLGDIFGHKPMVIMGYAIMSFWSVVAAVSHYIGYEMFFIARGFQGVGASLMVPNGLAILGRTYPPGSKQKIISFTIFGLCAPIGAYLGMVFGALFAKFASWSWSFYSLAIVTFLLAVSAQLVLINPPKTTKQMRSVKHKLRDMDWLGAITGVAGLVCVQVSLVSAPAAGWSTQYIYMLLIIGVLLITFFVVVELRIAEQPLVPFKMLKTDVTFVLSAMACGWAAFGIWIWFLWKFLMGIKQDTPLQAALHVLPIVPVAFVAAALTAWTMRACEPSWTLFWALAAFTFGPLLLAIDSNVDKTPYWAWTFVSLLVIPFGMDMSFPAATLIMSNFFPPQQQGVAGSLISTVINYSISLGLGLASTVEVHVNSHGLNPMAGIRGGWFMGVGLGGLGTLICVAFVIKSIFFPAPKPPKKGPPGSSHGGGFRTASRGRDMQIIPPGRQGRKSRSGTVSSRATTMVGDFDPQSPMPSDIELYKAFNFDTPAASRASRATTTRTQSISTLGNDNWANSSRYISGCSTKPRQKSHDHRYKSRDRRGESTRHNRSNSSHSQSTFHIHTRTNSNYSQYQFHLPNYSCPTSPAPSTLISPVPSEPRPVYRAGRRSWDSGASERDRYDGGRHGPSRGHRRRMYTSGSTVGSNMRDRDRSRDKRRDPDGFEIDSKPRVPPTGVGEKF